MTIKVKRLTDNAKLPVKSTPGSAGFDICAIERVVIYPGERKLVRTGLSTEFDEKYALMVCSRSGLALKHGISVLNSPGIIDSDYRGEIGVILHNAGNEVFITEDGTKVAQLLIIELATYNNWGLRFPLDFTEVKSELTLTARGEGGFGSTDPVVIKSDKEKFDDCEKCGNTGTITYNDEFNDSNIMNCPSCEGRGYLINK